MRSSSSTRAATLGTPTAWRSRVSATVDLGRQSPLPLPRAPGFSGARRAPRRGRPPEGAIVSRFARRTDARQLSSRKPNVSPWLLPLRRHPVRGDTPDSVLRPLPLLDVPAKSRCSVRHLVRRSEGELPCHFGGSEPHPLSILGPRESIVLLAMRDFALLRARPRSRYDRRDAGEHARADRSRAASSRLLRHARRMGEPLRRSPEAAYFVESVLLTDTAWSG